VNVQWKASSKSLGSVKNRRLQIFSAARMTGHLAGATPNWLSCSPPSNRIADICGNFSSIELGAVVTAHLVPVGTNQIKVVHVAGFSLRHLINLEYLADFRARTGKKQPSKTYCALLPRIGIKFGRSIFEVDPKI
jgi:hypothetical protein